MKILWLSHLVPYPPKGGVLQRAYHLIREVSRYHEVDLIAFNQRDLIGIMFDNQEEGLREAREVLGAHCRHVEILPIDSDQKRHSKYLLAAKSLLTSDPYTINWLKSTGYAASVKKSIAVNDYDLVHFDTISLIPYYAYAEGIPTVLDHHNIESHMLLRRAENESSRLKSWYYRQEGFRLEKIESLMCPQFSLNITCSDMDRRRLELIAEGSRVEEVPNGVDTGYFKPDRGVQQTRSLIFIGTLSWYPNIEAVRFIGHELWPILKSAISGLTIDIIGVNPPIDIKRLGESDKDFHVHGFVDDIRPYMNKAAVYVCPIRDGGGTKLKVLDALAMEKAVVAHPIACEGIDVNDGDNVVFAETVDEYVQAITRLLEDNQLRRDIGINARHLIEERYAYEKVGKRLSVLYESCAL